MIRTGNSVSDFWLVVAGSRVAISRYGSLKLMVVVMLMSLWYWSASNFNSIRERFTYPSDFLVAATYSSLYVSF